MQMKREAAAAETEDEAVLEMSGDPSPETNGRVVFARAGSRVAAEEALGSQALWAEHLMSLAVWPAVLLTIPVTVAAGHGHVLPTLEGQVLGVLVAALLGYCVGGRVPNALAHMRRIPLVLLAAAAGGLGACIGALTMGAVVLASPLLQHTGTWLLGGASFGLAYGSLLLVPTILARLGQLPARLFAVVRLVATLVAGLYAGWVA